ncbi:MAG: hypothetical protein K2X93_26365 [Candidatus Obscuribacterales bacterium]|nr:hypothetical protein [Candidatus Obscuribacterales bacterium]
MHTDRTFQDAAVWDRNSQPCTQPTPPLRADISVVKLRFRQHPLRLLVTINSNITTEAIEIIRSKVADITARASQAIAMYVVDLMRATRPTDPTFAKVLDKERKPYYGRIAVGGSLRVSKLMMDGAACNAWLDSREFISPEDVKIVFRALLPEHIRLTDEALHDEGFSAETFVASVIETVTFAGDG